MAEDRINILHREAPLTDIHVHPAYKAYIFRRNLWRHYCSGRWLNPFSSRADFKTLIKGSVGVIWASHFLPQRQFFSNCFWLRLFGRIFLPTYGKMTAGLFMPRVLEQMKKLEDEINKKPDLIELATSAAEVRRIRGQGKIAVVHVLEGAHLLDGRLDNLEILAKRGVALLTLNHFYPNGVAAHVDAIPEKMFIRKICKFDFQTDGQQPLTPFGRDLIKKMNELNMIVDIAHCSPEARTAVYAELDGNRPIVASHAGVTKLNPHPYNLDDDDIREIARRGGAIGIMFMTAVLDAIGPKKGLPAIWSTMEHIYRVTDSWDHIMLGTDFDGFTDPPDDVRDESQLGRVTGMLLERGLAETEVKKIIGGNAQRVLEAGWR